MQHINCQYIEPDSLSEEAFVRNGTVRIARRPNPLMRVPEDMLKCVGFIGEVAHRDSTGIQADLCATGFFVAIPCESTELCGKRCVYFVTAKHVAKDLESKTACFLVNRKGGGTIYITDVRGDYWTCHPKDMTADVAVVQVVLSPEADVVAIALEHFGIPARLNDLKIGIGDEVITTGLFTAAPGLKQNQPILRFGNIAMMPTEQIQTELGYADVFLVESRSIGGLSGSPVFVRHTLAAKVSKSDGTEDMMFANGPGITLLGMAHGHWDIRESEINKPRIIHDSQRGVNMGIAIVVPAIKIFETLYHPGLIALRKEQEQKAIKQGTPGLD